MKLNLQTRRDKIKTLVREGITYEKRPNSIPRHRIIQNQNKNNSSVITGDHNKPNRLSVFVEWTSFPWTLICMFLLTLQVEALLHKRKRVILKSQRLGDYLFTSALVVLLQTLKLKLTIV